MGGLLLTIGSLFFIGLLMVIYFNKKRFLFIRNKIYRYMLIVSFILLLTEIFSTVLVASGYTSAFSDFLFRIHWFTGIIWFSLLYYYSNCFLKNLEADSLKELIKSNKLFIRRFIEFLIISIIYFFVPFNDLSNKSVSYIPGPAAIYVLSFCALVVIILVIFTIKNHESIPFRKKVSISLMIIELIIVFICQIMFEHIAISAIGLSLQMFFLYFIIENPDLELITELEQTKKEIDRSNRAKSDFLSNMSHEIRTPMNAIIGFSESILNSKRFNKKSAISDIENISKASNNLLDIINNILDISKIESGIQTLEEREYSLKEMITDLSDIIRQRLKEVPIKFVLDIDEELPDRLYGDYTKIYQILLNLLINAVKYTEVGKIILSVKGTVNLREVKLKFSVKDTGFGIKEEDYNKLFAKFSRLRSATEKEIEGTGLGLIITKEYVELLGGNISFDSTYGVGTTFYVDLSQKIIDRQKIGSIEKIDKITSEITYFDCSKYNVLIVDDNSLNIKVCEKLLSPYKFNITAVTSGKDCIYKIKEGNHYDLIFMDHMMPEMDGIETLNILKKLDCFDIPPVVALTANAITGMKKMYLDAGFDDYLSKPINTKELNRVIVKYFKR